MAKKELLVYGRWKTINFEICLPDELVGDFITTFGMRFLVNDMHDGPIPRSVEKVYWQGSWHIKIALDEDETGKFQELMKEFSKKHEIAFRDF